MAKKSYSKAVCQQLEARIRSIPLALAWSPAHYATGHQLELSITTAWPEVEGKASFTIEKFAGGGFAGQVYRCHLDALELRDASVDCGLAEGGTYAVKILVPPSRFSVKFRNFVYWLAFQGPFSAQVNRSACRAGLLWPKVLRLASAERFGTREAVADTYASFFDDRFRAYGEVREWVEGRTWRLEADSDLKLRKQWRTIDPRTTGSPEYIAKKQFMTRFVTMLHEMGAAELARQYEWWTMKSQPNSLKRAEAGSDPAAGLCAVDFRAGLALVPYLPMSPGDFPLIWQGLRRGSLAQFDRCEWDKLQRYVAAHSESFAAHEPLLAALRGYDNAYRRAMPDLSHQGLKLLTDKLLRRDVRHGLADGYYSAGVVDDAHRDRLAEGRGFTAFYLIGAIPFLGRFLRKMWGRPDYRTHITSFWTQLSYLQATGRRNAAIHALKWYQAGRIGERQALYVAEHVWLYWLERLTVGWLPIPALHRGITEPKSIGIAIANGVRHLKRFLTEATFREEWLCAQVEEGRKDGMLTEAEYDTIMGQVRDPFIGKYLQSVGVHLLTLPITQIVSVITGACVAGWMLANGQSKAAAGAAFAGIVIFFQFTPISPGSICRGLYVVYLMIRERDWRDYVVAAPLSFLKYIGYLSFPLQMTASYPELAQFMAGRWATGAVHIIPVFGEQGALIEHAVFDLFFNRSRALGQWAGRHVKGLLNFWLLIGMALIGYVAKGRGIDWSDPEPRKTAINLILIAVGAFILPRILMYPVMRGRGKK
jgi:hypothetical protein